MNIWSRSVLTVSRIGSSIRADAAVKKVYTATEKFPHRFPVHHFTPRKPCENFAVSQDKQQDRQQDPRILGHDRAIGDARDAHAVSEYEPQARGNVYDNHGILHACVPAVESEEHDTGGYRPDAGVEIVVYDFVAVHGP